MEYDRHDVNPGDHPDVLIFAHGLGGNGSEILDMVQGLLKAVPAAPEQDLIVLAPHAPIAHNGAPTGGMRAWYYQILDDEVRLDLLENSLQALDWWIQDIKSGKELGKKPNSICLAGFSQGGTIAVSYPLMYPGRVEYSGNFAGYIPRYLKIKGANPDLYGRMLWGHGTLDYCNDYYLAEWGFPQLKALGVDFLHMHDPVGHTVHPRWFNEMLVQWLLSPKMSD